MKRQVPIWLLLCAVALAVAFAALWRGAVPRRDAALRELAAGSAGSAAERFDAYASSLDEADYWYGVAELRSFQSAYRMLTEQAGGAAEYTACNRVYGALVLDPEQGQAHAAELARVLALLAADPEDPYAWIGVSELANALEYG